MERLIFCEKRLPPGWPIAVRLQFCSTEIFACLKPPGADNYVPVFRYIEIFEPKEWGIESEMISISGHLCTSFHVELARSRLI